MIEDSVIPWLDCYLLQEWYTRGLHMKAEKEKRSLWGVQYIIVTFQERQMKNSWQQGSSFLSCQQTYTSKEFSDPGKGLSSVDVLWLSGKALLMLYKTFACPLDVASYVCACRYELSPWSCCHLATAAFPGEQVPWPSAAALTSGSKADQPPAKLQTQMRTTQETYWQKKLWGEVLFQACTPNMISSEILPLRAATYVLQWLCVCTRTRACVCVCVLSDKSTAFKEPFRLFSTILSRSHHSSSQLQHWNPKLVNPQYKFLMAKPPLWHVVCGIPGSQA